MICLGIVAALPGEASCLTKRRLAADQLLRLSDGVLLRLCGIGAQRARLAALELRDGGATALVSWGSACGLDPRLEPGTLVLPQSIIAANQRPVAIAADWRRRLLHQLGGHLGVCGGIVAESLSVLTGPAEKQVLFQRTGAVAADMESAAVGSVAERAQLPFLSIRAVADPAWLVLPPCALSAIDESGSLRGLRLVTDLMRRPSDALALLRLARDFRAAQRTLSRVRGLAGVRLGAA